MTKAVRAAISGLVANTAEQAEISPSEEVLEITRWWVIR